MIRKITLLGVVGLLGACSDTLTQKGTVTIAGRGAVLLTTKGDQLMSTGVYAKKNVSSDFAMGYAKGQADMTWREYWAQQDAQRWVHFYTSRSVFHAVFGIQK
jgi:hypothetical protein